MLFLFCEFEDDGVLVFVKIIMEVVICFWIVGDSEIIIMAFAAGEFEGIKVFAGVNNFNIAFASSGPIGDLGISVKVEIDDRIIWAVVAGAVGFEWFSAG